jgi:outer membrane protein OmpA-like peptidoglycan-associated protein
MFRLQTGFDLSKPSSRMDLRIAMKKRDRYAAPRPATLLVVFTLAAAVALPAGCSGSHPPPPHSYAFVVGDRANTVVPQPAALAGMLPQNLVPGAIVAAFAVDGSPGGVSLYDKPVPKAGTDFDQKSVPGQVIANLRHALDGAKAATPEADTLGSIDSAARALRDADGDKTLIVADSMLSTAGVLQFQNGLLDATPEDVVASVNKEELPDIKGVDVQIYGAGEVRPPQGALTQSKHTKLEQIWTLLLKQGGAKSVSFHGAVDEKKNPGPLPPVTIVPISQQVAAAPPPPHTCVHVLPESEIAFVPDTADFVDPATARQTIQAIAASMRGCPGTITVTGTTSSWGTPEGRQKTSQERADKVRDELAATMGIPTSQIVARGVGMDFPEYVNDRDPHGRLMPAEAAKNRTVRITAQ